jgi:hypothetical protein
MLRRNMEVDTVYGWGFGVTIARKNIGFLLTARCFGAAISDYDCNRRKN